MPMTYAEYWSTFREWYLEIDDEYVREVLTPALIQFAPIYIADTNIGDQGTVDFEDGSSITWDWDNGHFGNGLNGGLQYPYTDDPLYWTNEDTIEEQIADQKSLLWNELLTNDEYAVIKEKIEELEKQLKV